MACDLAERGALLGPHTIARCNEAVRLYCGYGADRKPVIVLGAGFAPTGQPAQHESMAVMMKKYFVAAGVAPGDIFHAVIERDHNVWGSGQEITSAFSTAFLLLHLYREHGDGVVWFVKGRVRVVTSAYHVARCVSLAHSAAQHLAHREEEMMRRSGRTDAVCMGFVDISGAPVQYGVSLTERLREIAKHAVTLGYLVFGGSWGARKLGLTH